MYYHLSGLENKNSMAIIDKQKKKHKWKQKLRQQKQKEK